MLLDELDVPLDDVVVVDRLQIADYNESNILPQNKFTLDRLLKWLNPTKYEGDGSELKKHTASHLKDTSQWLIDSPVFEQWHQSDSHGILWIRGVPGTGKSVLAAKLIAQLASEEYPVLYFFFRHTIQSNHRPEAALRDWIAQILPFSPPLQLALKNLTSGDINICSVDDLSTAELWHLLRLALKGIPKAYCVVDALDEMDHEVMESFLQVLDQLGHVHPDKIKLIITSRPIATIEKIVRDLRLLDIRLGKDKVNPDILKYLHHRLDQMPLASKIRDAIIHQLLPKADGLFLYAKFAMDNISGLESMTIETVTEALDDTPVNISLMYRNLLREHMARTDLPNGFCILVLQLVTHATRPLRLLEIADCIKVSRPEFGEDIAILKSHIRTSCGPLLEVLPDESVRVVHHSLTEYLFGLTRSGSDEDIPLFEPGPMHNLLALTCLSYLRAGCLDNLKVDDPMYYHMHLHGKEYQLPPFLMYAATNWHTHTKKSFSQGFLQDEANSDISALLMTPEYPRRLAMLDNLVDRSGIHDLRGVRRDRDISLEAEALLFAIQLNLTSFVEYFLSHDHEDAAKCPGAMRIEPPLHKAVRNGNLDIVRLLINKGAQTNRHNSRGETPLHLALGDTWRNMRVYPAIVEHLLGAGADPWQDTGRNEEVSDTFPGIPYPPIEKAFASGNEAVAKLFLPYIKSKEMAQRALHWVIGKSPKPEIINLILELDLVDINGRTNGETLLSRACAKPDPIAASILLEAGADPNVPRGEDQPDGPSSPTAKEGRNVLHVLAVLKPRCREKDTRDLEERIERCFKLVLDAGVHVNQVDDCKITPLHLARTPCIAKLLLDAGADPLAKSWSGSTPLHVAYSVDVIEVLLTKIDINIRDCKGRTILLRTYYGNNCRERTDGKPATEKALRLLDLGADPNITDNDGDSIFHYLASQGGLDNPDGRLLFKRLIQIGADANLRNTQGQTAIHKFKLKRSRESSKLTDLEVLLERTDIDINALDNDGNTFLFRVIDDGHISSDPKELNRHIATMAKAGARFDVTDRQGRTLLHAATRYCHDGGKVLKALVEQGVDPKQTDNEGNTIWHAMVPHFVSSMMPTDLIQSITALGVDIRKPNNRGRLPLHIFCDRYQGHLRRMRRPGYICHKLEFGTSLFDYMLEQGHEYINWTDNDGVLPIHLASTFSTYLTRMILDAGADATLVTHEGLNVFHLAARCRQSNTIGLLMDWFKARTGMEKLVEAVNAKDERGRNPLYYACASGHYQSVQLLIEAGAVIDFETYEGSALQGCVEFEKELEDQVDNGNSAFEAVHLAETTKPKEDTAHPDLGSLRCFVDHHENRIDDILGYLVNNTTPSNWRAIDRAIAIAANRRHNYTVESLLRVRKSLCIKEPLSGATEVQACLERRASVLTSLTKGDQAGNTISDRIRYIIEHRIYHIDLSQINEFSPKPEIKEFYEVCLELARCGYASLLDVLLTPGLVSDFEKCSLTTKYGSRKRSGGDMVSLLIAACQSEQPNLPVIKVLVKKGAKLDKYSITAQTTALHTIVKTVDNHWWQTAQALPYMLDQSLDLEVRNDKGLTPLNATLDERGQSSWSCQAAELLVRAGADPSSLDDGGKSCLERAVGHKSLFKLLLQHGEDIGPAELAAAILAKDLNMLEMMLASGADPNARRVGQETPSSARSFTPKLRDPNDDTNLYALDFLMTRMGYEDHDPVCESMMKLLHEYGADPNSRYPRTTIVHRILQNAPRRPYAKFKRRNCYLDAIIEHPLLDVNLKDATGMTILQAAYRVGDMRSTQVLLERGCNIYEKDKSDRNLLHLFLDKEPMGYGPHNRKEFLQYPVTLAPELLRQADNKGKTPLHYAIELGSSEEEIEFFVSNGADVCAKDVNGNTPLHLLFKESWELLILNGNMVLDEPKTRLVRLFLSRGADMNARNQAGETPIFSYFREGGMTVRIRGDKEGYKTSRCAHKYRNLNDDQESETALEQEPLLWTLFEELGIDWNVVNGERESLLHVVAAGWSEIAGRRRQQFQFLMGKGLNALVENNMHQTALDVAAANGAEDILALFNVE